MATPNPYCEATTSDNVSVIGDIVDEPMSGSRQEIGLSTRSSSIKGKRNEGSHPAAFGQDVSDDRKFSNLVGQMNNLISTDLDKIVDGRDLPLLGWRYSYACLGKSC